MNKELIDILRIYRSDNIGSLGFKYLIQQHESPSKAIEYMENNEHMWKGRNITLASEDKIIQEINETLEYGAQFITYNSDLYPSSISMAFDRPPILIVHGNVHLLQKPMISIVGTRHPSINGIKFCRQICNNLPFVSVSGLAIGIDTVVHESTIDTGTIAVLAGGINTLYPPSNSNLFYNIKEKGLLVTDRPIHITPSASLFPKRNSIIAGLGLCTVVIESTLDSGAIITAKKAKIYKRDVFAVPGHPFDNRYDGNNFLLKNGAKILLSQSDISINNNQVFENINFIDQDFSNSLLSLISYSPCDIEDIIYELDIPIEILLSTLGKLELEGIISVTPDMKIQKTVAKQGS